jgi:hypothetical protein
MLYILYNLVAKVLVSLYLRCNIARNAVSLSQLRESIPLSLEPTPTLRARKSYRLSHGWVRVL